MTNTYLKAENSLHTYTNINAYLSSFSKKSNVKIFIFYINYSISLGRQKGLVLSKYCVADLMYKHFYITDFIQNKIIKVLLQYWYFIYLPFIITVEFRGSHRFLSGIKVIIMCKSSQLLPVTQPLYSIHSRQIIVNKQKDKSYN